MWLVDYQLVGLNRINVFHNGILREVIYTHIFEKQ